MSPEQTQLLKSQIALAKVHPSRVSEQYVYQRAWNDALEFVERSISEIEGGKND